MHVALVEAATVVEYLFAVHDAHGSTPGAVLYLPATHAVHVPPLGPLHPLLQVQLVEAELPLGELAFDGQALHVAVADAPTAVEYVPAVHCMHTVVPVNVLYLPASHAVHVVAATPAEYVLYLPVSHAVHVDAAGATEYVPPGHAPHVALADAPTAVEFVPAAHSVHTAAPGIVVYLPGTHNVHVSPADPVDPALQMQSVKAALPAGDRAFDGHTLHVALADAATAAE